MSEESRLFTGIRVEEGRCNLLARHLDRLVESAATLGFKIDREELERALTEAARTAINRPPSRVRVTVSKDGSWEITEPQSLLLDAPQLQAVLWPDPIDSRDPWLRHKTTPRPVYDRAVGEAHSVGFIDAIFHNERGFVTEGASHSIFVRHGSIWRTPTLSAGIFPGVYRSYVLEKWPTIQEEDFTIAELLSAEEVWLTNALRGIRKVSVYNNAKLGIGHGSQRLRRN